MKKDNSTNTVNTTSTDTANITANGFEISSAIEKTKKKQEKEKLEQERKQQQEREKATMYEGLESTRDLVQNIVLGAFKSLYESDRKATSYTLIKKAGSAVEQYIKDNTKPHTQDKEKLEKDQNQDQNQDKPKQKKEKPDIIQNYIQTNELCSPLWLEYYDLGMSMATYKGLPDAYEKATGTITYHIQRIATHILCYFFKHLTVEQIATGEYKGCYHPDQLTKLMYQTDANGTALYFKVVTKYFRDNRTHKIIDADLLHDNRYNNGLVPSKWQKENIQKFYNEKTKEPDLLPVFMTDKQGERVKVYRKPQAFIFDQSFCAIYREYEHGYRSVPYNPFVQDRLYYDGYEGLDFYNCYRPPFLEMPKIPAKYKAEIQEMFEQYNLIMSAVANYDQDQIDFLNDFATHLVRRPFEKVEYITVLVSELRGLGKGIITHVFQKLAGNGNYIGIQKFFKNIIGEYNSCLGKTVLQTHEELGENQQHEHIEELPRHLNGLKEKTTQKTAFLRDLYEQGYEGLIFPRIVCNTNFYSECVPESGERRQAFIIGNEDKTRQEEYRARGKSFGHKLDEKIGTYFIAYLYDYYSKREYSRKQINEYGFECELDFAHAYDLYPCFKRNNSMLRAKTICTKSEVVARALYDLANELKDIEAGQQTVVGSTLLMNSQRSRDLQNIVDFANIDKTVAISAYNIIHKLVSLWLKTSDPAIQIIICYIKNVLEQIRSTSEELTSFYEGKNKAVEHPNKYGKLLSAFANEYPQILEKREDPKRGNAYRLKPNFKDSVIQLVTDLGLDQD